MRLQPLLLARRLRHQTTGLDSMTPTFHSTTVPNGTDLFHMVANLKYSALRHTRLCLTQIRTIGRRSSGTTEHNWMRASSHHPTSATSTAMFTISAARVCIIVIPGLTTQPSQ